MTSVRDRPWSRFDEAVQVLERAGIEDAEPRVLYLHPDSQRKDPGAVQITSSTPTVVERVMRDGPAAAVASDDPSAPFAQRLQRMAGAVRAVLEEARPDDEPRLCDVASLGVARAADALSLDAHIVWNPDVHYFAVATDSDSEWVVDLTADQFRAHPASRTPLLLERGTLELRHALSVHDEGPPWTAVAAAAEATRDRLDAFDATATRVCFCLPAREALAKVLRRHLDVTERAQADAPPDTRSRLELHARAVRERARRWTSA